jgi:hypothetical protein
MHLTLPPNFIDSIRKHTIQGKMAYAPIVFRLENGYTEVNINGFWDIFGFGLFGMYKSDWKSVGGWDIQKFANKWSGEDTELFERCGMHFNTCIVRLFIVILAHWQSPDKVRCLSYKTARFVSLLSFQKRNVGKEWNHRKYR